MVLQKLSDIQCHVWIEKAAPLHVGQAGGLDMEYGCFPKGAYPQPKCLVCIETMAFGHPGHPPF